jgi:hypothetical protein
MKINLSILLFLIVNLANCQTLVSISVIPNNPTIGVTTTLKFKAIGIYSDNSTQDISNTVTWTSGSPAVATISNALGTQGGSTAVTIGTSMISPILGSISGNSLLTIVADADGDAVLDNTDNCPFTVNPFQNDFDGDNIGDACDCSSTSNPLEVYCTDITIAAFPSNSIATGTNVTFYSTLKSGYINSFNPIPNYQWTKNSLPVGANASTYSDNALNNGDIIQCTISDGTNCVVGNSQNSNSENITIIPLSINDNDFTNDNIILFPNPIKNILNIQSKATITAIEITDLNGRIILTSSQKNNNVALKTENITSGMYILKVTTENKTIVKKIIKVD